MDGRLSTNLQYISQMKKARGDSPMISRHSAGPKQGEFWKVDKGTADRNTVMIPYCMLYIYIYLFIYLFIYTWECSNQVEEHLCVCVSSIHAGI